VIITLFPRKRRLRMNATTIEYMEVLHFDWKATISYHWDIYYGSADSAELLNGIIIAVIHRRNTVALFDETINDI
jgi:hypothetical protein